MVLTHSLTALVIQVGEKSHMQRTDFRKLNIETQIGHLLFSDPRAPYQFAGKNPLQKRCELEYSKPPPPGEDSRDS